MCKKFVPFAHAKSIYEIDVSFYKRLGIEVILCDLDNTLDSYKTKTPSEIAFQLFEKLQNNGLKVIITSNNTGERVKTYADAAGITYWNSIGKPFARKLLKKLKENNYELDKVILIGDQTGTDIACANRAHIKSVLTDKIVKEDQPVTRFNRLFDKPMRRKLERKGLLVDWRER